MNTASPTSSGTTRQTRGAGGVTRRVTPSGEICTRRSDARQATRGRRRHGEQRAHESPGGRGDRGVEESVSEQRDVRQERPDRSVDADARDGAEDRADHRVDRGDRVDLRALGADQPHRGVALLPAGSGHPGGVADQHQHRYQQRDRAECEPELVELRRGQAAWRGLDRPDPDRVRPGSRRSAGGCPMTMVRSSGLCRPAGADGAGERAGESVGELVGGDGAQQRGQRGRGVVLPGGRHRGQAGHRRCAGGEGRDVQPLDGLAGVLVLAVVPQQ